ncbi:hypothetical protein [Sphingomonas sp. G-3-2-10]|uniref:hypothetical protein n=1 Tax=Sphingomonas sp. G-3-2-10 TaxID=2728838 RepID=UPI00146D02E1|nr:hypothetical protein [Sphingomonas sp. G-3-2-10]NML04173.1 hypothetical protein [Sphingomonas sp. G-3-2-10]
MDRSERIVAVGLLTARDLERLGNGFDRAFAVKPDARFEDLIVQLEAIEWGGDKPPE